mmetsp:Transcript_66898/g.153439  ORF Transcript_66898/g.153439 Transcript_66898/m.153439 type:complete len:234 (+) Transcript_66898:118-819(+)
MRAPAQDFRVGLFSDRASVAEVRNALPSKAYLRPTPRTERGQRRQVALRAETRQRPLPDGDRAAASDTSRAQAPPRNQGRTCLLPGVAVPADAGDAGGDINGLHGRGWQLHPLGRVPTYGGSAANRGGGGGGPASDGAVYLGRVRVPVQVHQRHQRRERRQLSSRERGAREGAAVLPSGAEQEPRVAPLAHPPGREHLLLATQRSVQGAGGCAAAGTGVWQLPEGRSHDQELR